MHKYWNFNDSKQNENFKYCVDLLHYYYIKNATPSRYNYFTVTYEGILIYYGLQAAFETRLNEF